MTEFQPDEAQEESAVPEPDSEADPEAEADTDAPEESEELGAE
jgi:hypothetical protein